MCMFTPQRKKKKKSIDTNDKPQTCDSTANKEMEIPHNSFVSANNNGKETDELYIWLESLDMVRYYIAMVNEGYTTKEMIHKMDAYQITTMSTLLEIKIEDIIKLKENIGVSIDFNEWLFLIGLSKYEEAFPSLLHFPMSKIEKLQSHQYKKHVESANIPDNIVQLLILKREEYILKQTGKMYVFLAELGHGNFGVTYLVNNTHLNIALKKVELKNKDEYNCAKKEAGLLCGLSSHPHIVEFLSAFLMNETLYIEMCVCDGGTVHDLIKQHGVTEFGSLRIIEHTARGLQYLHSKNICHRDIKPKNLLIKNDKVLIGDMGMARYIGEDDNYTSAIGYQIIKPPEVLHRGNWTLKADIWQLGLVSLAVFTGNSISVISTQTFGTMTEKLLKDITTTHLSNAERKIVDPMLCRNYEKRLSSREVVCLIKPTENIKNIKSPKCFI